MRVTRHLMWAMALLALTMSQGCAQNAVRGLPQSVLAEAIDAARLPGGGYTEALTWEAEGPLAGHRLGHRVEDPQASGGAAWEAALGDPYASLNTALYGPYAEDLRPGDYVAFLRLAVLDGEVTDSVGQMDACVGNGQTPLGWREVPGVLFTPGRYAMVPLPISYPGGRLEVRFNWAGYATVRLDKVVLYRLEGGSAATNHWRVPEAAPSGDPHDLALDGQEPRPYPNLFPISGPVARTLTLCDLSRSAPDERLMAYCLQGLVNRQTPQVYCLATEGDRFWLDNMLKRGWVDDAAEAISPKELLALFPTAVRGMVITDPNLPATRNIATMLASVEDALVVSPRLARQIELPVIRDLRGMWTTSADAYQWAFDNLWPRLTHHVIAVSWPDHLALRDYLVQNKVFIFWLSGALDGAQPYADPTREVRMVEKMLAKMPANIPCLSYPWAGKDVGIGEGPGVSLLAEFGKYLVGSVDCSNMTIHSGLRVPAPKQRPAPPCPKLDPAKVYVSFIMSDGDNLPVLTESNFPQMWRDPLRGSLPIGWTVSPSAALLLPDVVNYYYSTATTNDPFLSAVSGVGYTYPDLYGKRYRAGDRERVYDGFLAQTAQYMQRSDLREQWLMNATRAPIIARFAEQIPFLTGMFPDYGRRVVDYRDATYLTARNVPVFHAVTGWREGDTMQEAAASLIAEIHRMAPTTHPGFLHAFVWNWGASLPLLKAVADGLGPDYVLVRPDHLAQLARGHFAAEGLQLALPKMAMTLEGLGTELEGRLHNATDGALEVALEVTGGLDQATLDAPSLRLDSAEDARFVLSGKPTGEAIQVVARGGFGTREAAVKVRQVARGEVLGELPARGVAVQVGHYEGEGLAHRDGMRVKDDTASDGAYWGAEPGKTEATYVVFGPYAPLEKGRYVVLFRLKRTSAGNGLLATLDTCVGGGIDAGKPRNVECAELPAGEWRYVPLTMDHPGGQFESRVQWFGAAGLAVDDVTVWRMDG